ncbi:neuroligin-1-like, partial [Nilaparvata lugens]|uniref:neuroligin-1-like n=1 Tax=Nilaparvata lugens TaxID=108931 RepID=UPI00193D88CA
MDVVAGLHWLRENLPAFGGDPERITLMGHGTGAALANYIAVSPVAKELLHRVILLSGSGLSPWALQREPLAVKRRVAEQTGCHGDLVDDDLAPCLRGKSLAELLRVRLEPPRFLPGFAPFVDGAVLPVALGAGGAGGALALADLAQARHGGPGYELADFPERDLLFGLTTTESYLDLSAQDLEFGFDETRRDRILRTYVRNAYYFHLNEIFSTLKNEYTDWERPAGNPLGVRDATLEVLSDGHTTAPLLRVGYLHSV